MNRTRGIQTGIYKRYLHLVQRHAAYETMFNDKEVSEFVKIYQRAEEKVTAQCGKPLKILYDSMFLHVSNLSLRYYNTFHWLMSALLISFITEKVIKRLRASYVERLTVNDEQMK